ncbi:thioredoxin family protein [Pseudogemmobacter sonorensis]|uniref:thioredoxin family protein n=1 Tax=Pseudogemmobacter sonorensis TaxID=2989681 RepID=UPI0036B7E13D
MQRRRFLSSLPALALMAGGAAAQSGAEARGPAQGGGAPEEVLGKGFSPEVFGWLGLDEGLALARETGKPVFLLVKTDWCPHCRNYRAAFADPRNAAFAGDYVFVMLDRDHEGDLSARLAPDGDYIPRTMILTGRGVNRPDLAPRWFFPRYFVQDPYADNLQDYFLWLDEKRRAAG